MNRRELREHIFRMLFCMAFHDSSEFDEQVGFYMEGLSEPEDKDISYMKSKTQKIYAVQADLDAEIDSVVTGWKTERMGRVDLTLIRLALFEMKYDADIPVGVAINEAVELAKRYGNTESASFVNGVLAKLA